MFLAYINAQSYGTVLDVLYIATEKKLFTKNILQKVNAIL